MSTPSLIRRNLVGRVTSDRMHKTIVVLVERRVAHPKYGKYIKRCSKILAHDEGNVARVSDQVIIQECRPLSKRKSWALVKVLDKVESSQ